VIEIRLKFAILVVLKFLNRLTTISPTSYHCITEPLKFV